MQPLRRRFLLVGVGVLVPVALLVWRALGSVAIERRMRHEVVAERLFDEMERALSDLLAREEARPVEAYGAAGAVPLAPAPDQPFIVGWFEVGPDGVVRTAESDAAVASVRRAAESVGHRPEPPSSSGTLARAQRSADQAKADAAPADDEKKAKAVSAYDALKSLNKAVEQRAARQKTMADEYAAKGQASSPAPIAREGDAERSDSPHDAFRAERLRDRRRPIVAAPMVGEVVGPQQLALYRTVLHDGGEYRQGLLLDVPLLGTWLSTQALGGSNLADFTTLVFATTGASLPVAPAAEFVYEHAFADPFVDLTTRLTLRPLPGIGGAGYVYVLSALLLAAMVAGMLALYRMVAVAVGFAERRSNFVAAVSHELKTPLTAIRMYGEMLRDGIVGSEAKRDEYYRHITAESERLSRLINNVLEFSKLEKGTRPVSLTVGPIAPVIAEAVALLRPHLEDAGFTLRVEVDPALPPARFERDALLQVLFNLVDNAVKYSNGASRPEIVLRAARAGDRIVLAVRDHGPGVPAAHLGNIFEPFYRGERELTRRSKGTGLGLALVRGLAEGMGATVLGRNAQDGGFEVEIGLVAASAS
jgi:signal transduction histidine kinase